MYRQYPKIERLFKLYLMKISTCFDKVFDELMVAFSNLEYIILFPAKFSNNGLMCWFDINFNIVFMKTNDTLFVVDVYQKLLELEENKNLTFSEVADLQHIIITVLKYFDVPLQDNEFVCDIEKTDTNHKRVSEHTSFQPNQIFQELEDLYKNIIHDRLLYS